MVSPCLGGHMHVGGSPPVPTFVSDSAYLPCVAAADAALDSDCFGRRHCCTQTKKNAPNPRIKCSKF